MREILNYQGVFLLKIQMNRLAQPPTGPVMNRPLAFRKKLLIVSFSALN